MNQINRKHIFVVALAWTCMHVLLFVYPGIRIELFDSKVYTQAGNHLIASGSFEKIYQLFYSLPIFLIGIFNRFENGLTLLVVLQSVISLFASFAIYKSAAKIFCHDRAGLISSVVFLIWWDVIQWNTALLTESIFCSLLCFLLLLITHFNNSKSQYALLSILLVLCMLTRPTGIVAIVSVLAFLGSTHNVRLNSKPVMKAILISAACVVSLLGALAMFSIWDFSDQYVKGNIVTFMDTYDGGDFGLRLPTENLTLPDSSQSPIKKMMAFVYSNPVHFLHAAVLKTFYLLSGVRPYYSILHNAYSACWLAILYLVFSLGIKAIADKNVRVYVLAMIIINCLLVAISTVDWDNRFYVPMAPAIAAISGGGALTLARKYFPRLRTPQ